MFGVKYRYIFVFLLAIYSFLNLVFTGGTTLIDFPVSNLLLFSFVLFIIFFVWEGNRLLYIVVMRDQEKFLPKIHPLVKLFLLSLVLVLAVCVIAILIIYSFERLNNFLFHLKLASGFGFRINLFLHCLNAIVFYMQQLKETQLEAEKLKKSSIEAQFEALRNQINPHFLFNSFNVLSSLVYKDADTSAKFIQELSKMYRYLLYHQEKKLVNLETEMDFIDSYIYLLKIRYGQNLQIEKLIENDKKELYIASASLQLLIENAIKHNIVSQRNPLKITISTKGNFLVIKNNLQEKDIKEISTSVGLANIKSRYQFLTNEKVKITKTEESFEVMIPLIQLGDI